MPMKTWLNGNKRYIAFLLLFGVFRTAVADWNPIPSASMRPTILEGDVVLVNRLAYDLKLPFTDTILAHLGEPLGVYTVEIGQLNTLVYLWGFNDLTDRAVRRAALAADPEFAAFRREVRNLLVGQSNRILIATNDSSGDEPR
jgi:hypothetical protein